MQESTTDDLHFFLLTVRRTPTHFVANARQQDRCYYNQDFGILRRQSFNEATPLYARIEISQRSGEGKSVPGGNGE
jgi:hypothetical protein